MSLQRITCGGISETLTHICEPCDRELGRVRGVILFSGDFDFTELIAALKGDTASAAETIIDEAITNGKAHLIAETTGTFDGGSVQTGDGYGDEENRVLGYQFTLDFNDPSYGPNAEFWSLVEKDHWLVVWRTETLLHIADKPATIQATDPVEADLTSAVTWHVNATWKSKNKPTIVPLKNAAKYFEGCWEVQA